MTPATSSSFQRPATSAGVFEPSLLRANRLFESTDLEDTRERISRVMQPHVLQPLGQRAQGRHKSSHMDFVRMGGIGLGAIDFGEAMRVDVDHVEDYHLVMFCLRGTAQALSDGQPVQASASQGMICAPGRSFVADLSPGTKQSLTVWRDGKSVDLPVTVDGNDKGEQQATSLVRTTLSGANVDIQATGRTATAAFSPSPAPR